MRTTSLFGLCMMLLLPFMAEAQFTKINRTNQQWIHHYAQFKVGQRFTVLADGGFRTLDWFHDPSMYIVRFGAAYNFHEHWRVGIGFANAGSFMDSDLDVIEYRPHQDISSEHFFRTVKFENRVRIEERMFKVRQTSLLLPLLMRFRYRFRLTAPIVSFSKAHPERRLLLLLEDEFFINVGEGIVNNVFDHNRMTLGPGFQITEGLTLALQYSYQWGTTEAENIYRQNSVLWFSIRHNVDFMKEKEVPAE